MSGIYDNGVHVVIASGADAQMPSKSCMLSGKHENAKLVNSLAIKSFVFE